MVDHCTPVVTTTEGFVDWNTFIANLFCEEDNLQAICSSCHDEKSAKEREERSNNKKKDQNDPQ